MVFLGNGQWQHLISHPLSECHGAFRKKYVTKVIYYPSSSPTIVSIEGIEHPLTQKTANGSYVVNCYYLCIESLME